MDREPKISEEVPGDENAQTLGQTAGKKTDFYKCSGQVQACPLLPGNASPLMSVAFRRPKKVVQPNGVLKGLPAGAMRWQVKRDAIIAPSSHEFSYFVL